MELERTKIDENLEFQRLKEEFLLEEELNDCKAEELLLNQVMDGMMEVDLDDDLEARRMSKLRYQRKRRRLGKTKYRVKIVNLHDIIKTDLGDLYGGGRIEEWSDQLGGTAETKEASVLTGPRRMVKARRRQSGRIDGMVRCPKNKDDMTEDALTRDEKRVDDLKNDVCNEIDVKNSITTNETLKGTIKFYFSNHDSKGTNEKDGMADGQEDGRMRKMICRVTPKST